MNTVHPSEGPGNNLDWAQFEAITCGLSPEFVDVYREFEVELPRLFDELQGAIALSSLQQVANLAHQIKGSAANFGFIGTSQQMHQLECEAQTDLLTRAENYLATAREAFEQAQREVRRRLGFASGS